MRSACAAHAHAHRLRRRQIRRRACWRRARGRGRRLRCNSAVVLRFRLCGRGRVSSPPTLQTQHDVVLIAHGGWAELGSHSTCAAVVAATAGAASRAVSASMTSSGSEYVIRARPPGCLRGPCEACALIIMIAALTRRRPSNGTPWSGTATLPRARRGESAQVTGPWRGPADLSGGCPDHCASARGCAVLGRLVWCRSPI